MQVSDELCAALTERMEAFGVTLEPQDCQNAFWAVMNSPLGGGNETIINTEARKIWDAKVAEVNSNGAPDPEPPAPDPDPEP